MRFEPSGHVLHWTKLHLHPVQFCCILLHRTYGILFGPVNRDFSISLGTEIQKLSECLFCLGIFDLSIDVIAVLQPKEIFRWVRHFPDRVFFVRCLDEITSARTCFHSVLRKRYRKRQTCLTFYA